MKVLSLLTYATFTLLTLGGCGKIINSSSQDRALYNPSQITGSAEFTAATAIINSKCASCHGSFSSYSEADFIANGLVVAQNPASSPIYYRNQGATSGPGPQDMPNSGTALTAEELQTVTIWINSIN